MSEMKWYQRTGVIFLCGFLCGMLCYNVLRVIVIENHFYRIMPHLGVFLFVTILILPVLAKTKDWYSK